MNILLWAPLGAGTHYWGPGQSAYRLLQQAPRGIHFELAHANPAQGHFDLFKKQHCLGNLTGGLGFSSLRYFIYSKKWLRKNAHRYDFFYGLGLFHQTVLPAFWAQNLGLSATIKSTGLGGGLGKQGLASRLLGLRKKRLKMLRQISHIVALSEEIEEELNSFGFLPPQMVKIPNGVDTTRFSPAGNDEKKMLRKELGLPERPTLLFVGGMNSRKQPHLILNILKHLTKSTLANVQAIFVGPERENGYLDFFNKHKNDLQLGDRVFWFDHSNEIEKYYRAADVFLLPSKNEGMPNAQLEAMACGLPSIINEFSGSKDLIPSPKYGWRISLENFEKHGFDAVCALLKNKNLYQEISENSKLHIRNNFSYDTVWKKYLQNCFS